MKFVRITAILLAVAVTILFVGLRTIDRIKYVRTHDIAGKILVTLDRTLFSGTATGYDVAKETKNRFPSIMVNDGKIIDGWGKPMEVSIEKMRSQFEVRITSPGPDGAMNTSDDVIREESIMTSPAPPGSP